MRVGFYQFRPLFGKPQKNLERVAAALSDVSADILVLPELAFSGYYFRNREEAFSFAEVPSDSQIVSTLCAICRQNDFYVVTGFVEKQGKKAYNSALLLGPHGIVHTYRKIHLFNEEKNWFDPGNIPLDVVEVRGARIGIMVCFDWIFPEVMRVLALKGADIICHPSNLVLAYCQDAMITRSLENGVFSITANRIGRDSRPQGALKFTGKSQVVTPRGERLFRAPSQQDCIYITEIETGQARDKNITAKNHVLKDRRPEYYGSLLSCPPAGVAQG